MLNKRLIETIVGLFMLAGIIAMFILAFKVSSLSQYSSSNAFKVVAAFDNIGDLKIRAPITIAGVRVGEVQNIDIDTKTFKAKVTMLIDKKQTGLPIDSSAAILTAGIIGANYIEISPGFDEQNLKEGDEMNETHPAIILENLISQFIYNIKNDKEEKKEDKKEAKKDAGTGKVVKKK
jgi:phospholipid/cholesterol/gamma-HCH transport system substrate-binding protein